jgi:hypothetical protein
MTTPTLCYNKKRTKKKEKGETFRSQPQIACGKEVYGPLPVVALELMAYGQSYVP